MRSGGAAYIKLTKDDHRVKGDDHAVAVREVVDQLVRWYMGHMFSGRELMRLIDAGTFSVSTTLLQTRKPTV